MKNPFGSSEELLESGQTLVKKAANHVAKQGQTVAQTTTTQVTGAMDVGAKPADTTTQQDTSTSDFVKDLYAPTPKNQTGDTSSSQTKPGSPAQTGDPVQQQKLDETRSKLEAWKKQHYETYYKPTFEPDKNPEKDEQPAEKVEREKQEEMMELQEKEKKKTPPLAVQREQQRSEKFPGASG